MDQPKSLEQLVDTGRSLIKTLSSIPQEVRYDDRDYADELFHQFKQVIEKITENQRQETFENWARQFGGYSSGASIFSSVKSIWDLLRDIERPDREQAFILRGDAVLLEHLEKLFKLGQMNPHKAGEELDRPQHNIWVQQIDKLIQKTHEDNPVISSGSNASSYLLGLNNAKKVLLGEVLEL